MNSAKCSDVNVLDLFEEKKLVKICAPMVRYSRLQFRNLVNKYNCDLSFTPMTIADCFCKSEKARRHEFTTNSNDTPLIVQFAANTVHDFVGAAYLVSPFSNGVDLNCGCPQSWAKQLGLGCAMLKNPQLIYDIVRQCRNEISKPFTISVKTRISTDIRETIEICRQLEMSGVSFLTIHARTSEQLTGNINVDSLKTICETVSIPVIANGGVKTLDDCFELQQETNCRGVMVANGILSNPTLFSGGTTTTEECLQNWLDICYNSTINPEKYETLSKEPVSLVEICEKPLNLYFQYFHHHLVFMLEKTLSRKQRQVFNNLQSFREVLDFIEAHFGVKPKLFGREDFYKYAVTNMDYSGRQSVYNRLKPFEDDEFQQSDILYDYEGNGGKYFQSKVKDCVEDDSDCDWSNIFLENG